MPARSQAANRMLRDSRKQAWPQARVGGPASFGALEHQCIAILQFIQTTIALGSQKAMVRRSSDLDSMAGDQFEYGNLTTRLEDRHGGPEYHAARFRNRGSVDYFSARPLVRRGTRISSYYECFATGVQVAHASHAGGGREPGIGH